MTTNIWRRLLATERGAGLIEYVLLIALIALVCAGAVAVFGNATGEPFSNASAGFAD